MAIRLRFVENRGLSDDFIEWREGTCMPFVPTHVECVIPDNRQYAGFFAGQHGNGGMQPRPPGYDHDTMVHELFLELPCSSEQERAFYDYVEASFGQPYDWSAILGFALPGHHHTKFNAICSAKMFLALRKADWFPSHAPLCVPAHCINPRDLLLILSAIIIVPH